MSLRLGNLGGYTPFVAFAPDGKTLATGSGDGTVKLWHSTTDPEALARKTRPDPQDPDNPTLCNNLAWPLATCPDPKFRDPGRAVALAKKAVELAPKEGNHWNTLGVAHYRAGDPKAAIAALAKSDELLKGNDLSFNAFFLAMAHWQLGNRDEARKWYDQAVRWMEKNKPQDEELRRFRAEAAELLAIKEKKE